MRYSGDKPCPEGGNWKLVKTREGSFWRRQRGSGEKAAELNDAYKAQNDVLKRLSPLAARLVMELRPYLYGLVPRRINNRVKTCLGQSLKEKGKIDYWYFKDLVFQPDHDIGTLLQVTPRLETGEQYVTLRLSIPEGGAVKRMNSLVTGYRFILIMVVGDPFGPAPLATYEAASGMYDMDKGDKDGCVLRLLRPTDGEPWFACLRIATYDGEQLSKASRHSGMMVVGWNKDGV